MPPDLNWDILFEILSAISDEIICLEENSKPARRLLSLMGTCRTLYKVGMPKLRKSDICIGSATLPRAVKFTDFILRDTSWPPCLKSLTVMTMMYSTWSRRNHSASRTNLALNMERILRQAPNLSSLEMDDAESLFSLTSRLGRAVSSLTKLNSIALHCVGDKTIAGLQKLRSPLTSVNLDFETYDSDLKDLDFLTYRKVHLTSLELSRTDDMAFCRTRYQNVHTLNIHSREPIHVRSVMTCFPNVKNFKWDPELDVKFDEDFAEERHASRDRDDNDDVDYSWKALGTLSADVFPCHALRLRGCHVRLWQGINLRPAELRLFGEALNEIRPTSLRMMLRLENWKTDMARLGDMYPLLVDITHLHITLDFTRCQLDLSTFMNLSDSFRGPRSFICTSNLIID
ncbi:hypothetical protein BXZ70DRAFT_568907 [Cristinia sonorae]|uniref:F-box domain-containing protein n=1 Tax=Cristinia sonorae TaxID=1940300 RepID=A0A8K0UFZ1_9AGAR|nr:hypothetical protein BXZ70DRAFT_568907 [Cristinia sonorae]